jgi:uncharacterized membrane protein
MTTSTRIEISPHCSLSTRGAWGFFAGVCVGSFAVAGFVAAQGFWPVLPFAGLEMALLGWALYVSMQRRFQRQAITITESDVQVEQSDLRQTQRVVFPRYWARVRIREAHSPLHPSRLTIESHGRSLEFGQFLNEQERRDLARQLRGLVGK